MRLSALRTRAEAEGVTAEVLEDALDTDNPKQTMIELLLQQHTSTHASQGSLRQELMGLRLKEIRARAKQAGVDADALEEAVDSDAPKEATIELLIQAMS